MNANYARTAMPMLRLFQMVGLAPRQIRRLSPYDRNRIARRVRREANAYAIPRFRATSSPYAVSRRRAKNRIARRTRRINRARA